MRTKAILIFWLTALTSLYTLTGIAQTPTWRPLGPQGTAPPSRSGHVMIYDEVNKRAVIFGGQDYTETSLGDTYLLYLGPGAERWQAIAPSGQSPQSRYMASAIYDAANQRLILFGGVHVVLQEGQLVRTFLNDVWALNLTPGQETWTELTPTGTSPSPRYMHGALYDADNQRMVIFGGGMYNASWVLRNDTWALDLTPGQESWTELTPGGLVPKPRNPYRAVYVPSSETRPNSQMIIFGGWNGRVALNDTYGLDLTKGQETWSKVRADGYDPGVRFGHTLIYDSGHDRVLTFSGWEWAGIGYLNDTWVLDLTVQPERWTELRTEGPLPLARDFSNAIFDKANREMVIYSGRNVNDAHALSLP